MNTLFRAVLLAGTTLGLSLGAANAAVITKFTPTVTQAAFNPQGLLILTLPQFDAALGTLTGATLQIEGIAQPQFQVLQVGTVAGTGTGATAVTYAVSGIGVAGLSASASSGLQTVSVDAGFLDLASSPPPNPIFFNPVVALSNLAALTGTGTIAFNINESETTSGTTETPGANLAFGGVASANLLLDIAYTYTPIDPVPEPASLAVLGMGLLGLGAVKRRKMAVDKT
jgi:hypothetical protein